MKLRKLIILLGIIPCLAFGGCKYGNDPQSSTESVQEQSVTVSEQISAESSAAESQPSEVSEEKPVLIPTKEDLDSIEDYATKFYVKRLSNEMKYHFVTLYHAALKFQKNVELAAPISDNDLTMLMFLLNYDCPELIHLGGDYAPEYDPEGNATAVSFTYCMKENEYSKARDELEKVRKIVVEKTAGKSEYNQEKAIYDMIFQNVVYKEEDTTSGSIYGALVKNVARCEGFSKSFAWCMRKAGLECMCVVGAQLWNENSAYSNHSWNIAKIDGEYYNVDITVDNVRRTESEVTAPLYGFLNTDDNTTYEKRSVEKSLARLGIPKCVSMKKNYHILNNLYIPEGEATEEKLLSILDSNFTGSGFSDLSIRYQSFQDYQDCYELIQRLVINYINNKGVVFAPIYYYNELSHTVMIDRSSNAR